jgi:hypothetical protein
VDARGEALGVAARLQAAIQRELGAALVPLPSEERGRIEAAALFELVAWSDAEALAAAARAREGGTTWGALAEAAGLQSTQVAERRLGPGRERDRQRMASKRKGTSGS